MRRRVSLVAPALLLCVACSSTPEAGPTPEDPAASHPAAYPSSIVVLGHSGTTGFNSDPSSPDGDVPENSWATGTNPAVNSVYRRILARNPAAEGHTRTFGVDGSDVGDLLAQEKKAAAFEPAPDLVIIQSIDNDIRCDGSDRENYEPFSETLTDVLDALTRDLPDAEVFFVDQWASAKQYDAVAVAVAPGSLTGTGPCDVMNAATGKLDPKREAYVQRLVDDYFAIIVDVCRRYPKCRTDEGAMQSMQLKPADLTPDASHLSVTGLHKMAGIAFDALFEKDSTRAGRLLFSRFDESSHRFLSTHTSRPDGSMETEIPMPGDEGGGRWSRSGDRIAVTTTVADGRIGTAIISPDGAVERVFDIPEDGLNLACTVWSPDDRRLACEGWDEGKASRAGIYTVRSSDGGGMVRVTRTPASLVDLVGDYSPDGTMFLFKRTTDEDPGPLMVVPAAGGRALRLGDLDVEDPGRYSRDGQTILTAAAGRILLLDASGQEIGEIEQNGTYLFGPVWSPEGERIAYSGTSSGFHADIYTSRPDGTDQHRVTSTPDNEIRVEWGRLIPTPHRSR